METVACDLCGNNGADVLFEQRDLLYEPDGALWAMVQCKTCGLVYLNPRPTVDEIAKYYPAEYPFYQRKLGLRLKEWVAGAVHWVYFAKPAAQYPLDLKVPLKVLFLPLYATLWWKDRLNLCRPFRRYPFLDGLVPGRLLDVGCGSGVSAHPYGYAGSIKAFKAAGWSVEGMDPSQSACDIARKDGLDVRQAASLPEAGFPAEAYDVIRLNSVLEHVHSPAATLAEACRLLRPGGRLIVSVPNYDGIAHRMFPTVVEVPRHLYYFTPTSLRAYCRRVGLTELEIHHETSANTFLLMAALHGAIPDDARGRTAAALLRPFLDLMTPLAHGDEITMVLIR